MKTIQEQLQLIKASKSIGLMTHVVAGYPSLAETEQLVVTMAEAGVDFIEIQIPFSDPIADGPTIMKANDVALNNGVTVKDAISLMSRLSQQVDIPLLFMGYYNTVFQYGVEEFCRAAEKAGAQGLIVPDIPYDEEPHEQFLKFAHQFGLAPIRVISPTSTQERIAKNLEIAKGFVYCTAVSGTTGARTEVENQTRQFLKMVKKQTDLPLALGFGISKPAHIAALVDLADIAVVGSAVINTIETKGISAVEKYIRSLVRVGLVR